MIYRILTENKQRRKLMQLVGLYYKGFTVIEATGYWRGESEKALIIEIAEDGSREAAIMDLATKIARLNDQEAVLIQRFNSHHTFLTLEPETTVWTS